MPDRIVRDELLESEKWLSLKDNADRLAFVALLLRADSLGNFSAEPFRLMRMWRDFGINSVALVAKTLSELADHDLVRLYKAEEKPLLHVPRFNQRTRYLKRVFPPSPWTSDEQKQQLKNNSPDSHPPITGLSPVEVKRSEVKRSKSIGAKVALESFEVTEPMSEWAVGLGLPQQRVMPETSKFFDHHVSKGSAFKDWDAAWRNWMRNAIQFTK